VVARLLDDSRSSSNNNNSRTTVRHSRLSSRRPIASMRSVATESGLDTALQRGHQGTRNVVRKSF
jgi:hypothetical protein